MTFYELQEQFWQMEAEQKWSPAQVKLYFWWLNQFNIARWPASIPRNLKQVASTISMDEKTCEAAKNVLVARGLIAFTPGVSGRSAIWGLSYSRNNSSEADRKNSGQLRADYRETGRKNSGSVDGNTSDCSQADRKNSGPIWNKKKNSSGVEEEEDSDTASELSKKNEEGAVVQINLPSDNPAPGFAHQGGGPAALPEGEHCRGGYVDTRLLDSDPRKWEEIPRDAAMVDEYLASINHPKAGRGELFYDYYKLVGWLVGTKPMRNWRIAVKSFGFREQSSSTPQAGQPNGRPAAGQKPTGNAGKMARALAERRRGPVK
ncbi:hypothetical protein [Hymenobacter tenuis]